MAGISVDRQSIDSKVAESILTLRMGLAKSESVAKWLVNNPVVDDIDPLVATHGYNEDEAYLLRYVFEQIELMRINSITLQETARRLTGLE